MESAGNTGDSLWTPGRISMLCGWWSTAYPEAVENPPLQELSGFGPGTLLWLSLLGHDLEQMDPEGHATFTMMWFCESSPLCLMEARNQANTLVSLASCPDFPVSSLLPVFFNSVIASSVCGSVIRFFHRTYKHSNYEIFYHYEVVSTLSPPLFV